MKNHSIACGVGGSYAFFEGSYHYRLIFFTTPVDDSTSDLFYSIWWPRELGDTNDAPPVHLVERATRQFLVTLADDLNIWRHQVYVETPAFARRGRPALRSAAQMGPPVLRTPGVSGRDRPNQPTQAHVLGTLKAAPFQ